MDNLRGARQDTATAEETHEPDYPSPTTGQQVEVILARQLAGYLALPVVIADPNLVVVYYNEAAERLFGRRFDEGGPIPTSDWSDTFSFSDEDGTPLPVDEIPLGIALRQRRVAHRRYFLQGMDGVRHHIDNTAIPLTGIGGRLVGVITISSEIED
jgi:PAS domain-containing protein